MNLVEFTNLKIPSQDSDKSWSPVELRDYYELLCSTQFQNFCINATNDDIWSNEPAFALLLTYQLDKMAQIRDFSALKVIALSVNKFCQSFNASILQQYSKNLLYLLGGRWSAVCIDANCPQMALEALESLLRRQADGLDTLTPLHLLFLNCVLHSQQPERAQLLQSVKLTRLVPSTSKEQMCLARDLDIQVDGGFDLRLLFYLPSRIELADAVYGYYYLLAHTYCLQLNWEHALRMVNMGLCLPRQSNPLKKQLLVMRSVLGLLSDFKSTAIGDEYSADGSYGAAEYAPSVPAFDDNSVESYGLDAADLNGSVELDESEISGDALLSSGNLSAKPELVTYFPEWVNETKWKDVNISKVERLLIDPLLEEDAFQTVLASSKTKFPTLEMYETFVSKFRERAIVCLSEVADAISLSDIAQLLHWGSSDGRDIASLVEALSAKNIIDASILTINGVDAVLFKPISVHLDPNIETLEQFILASTDTGSDVKSPLQSVNSAVQLLRAIDSDYQSKIVSLMSGSARDGDQLADERSNSKRQKFVYNRKRIFSDF